MLGHPPHQEQAGNESNDAGDDDAIISYDIRASALRNHTRHDVAKRAAPCLDYGNASDDAFSQESLY